MKGVLWVRVSSEPQSRGYSPDVQLRELREAAAKRSIEVIKELAPRTYTCHLKDWNLSLSDS